MCINNSPAPYQGNPIVGVTCPGVLMALTLDQRTLIGGAFLPLDDEALALLLLNLGMSGRFGFRWDKTGRRPSSSS